MARDFLLSWKVLAKMAGSKEPLYEQWLKQQNKALRVHVCLYSYFKAVGQNDSARRANDLPAAYVIDAFVERCLPPEALIDPSLLAPRTYYAVRDKFEEEDLEVFAIALALARDYTYLCVDEKEVEALHARVPSIKAMSIDHIFDAP